MTRTIMAAALTIAFACGAAFAQNAPFTATNSPRNLDIYWIDTEGGAATLIVSPTGESLLVDAGYPDGDRDAKRIMAAAQAAGLKKIDYFVLSHYHRDHEGGLAALAKMIPIDRFFDHGNAVDAEDQERLDDYRRVAGAKRTIVKPGDEIPLKGVPVLVVTSEEKQIANPINGGAANPLCADAAQMSAAGAENQRTVGLLLTYGKFTFLNLIDLDWQKEMELACPINKVGRVTMYQTSRHGSFDGAGAPAFLGAISPQVALVNNGPRKGLGQTDNRVKPITVAGKPTAPYEKNAYQPAREAAADRSDLADAPLAPRQGAQHGARHDRQFRGHGRLPGPLDQGIGQSGRYIHRHQRPQRIQQDLRGTMNCRVGKAKRAHRRGHAWARANKFALCPPSYGALGQVLRRFGGLRG